MKRLLSAAGALLCALGLAAPVLAQTTIIASHERLGGYDIALGTVSITAVDVNSIPITFSDATGYQNGPAPFMCHITAGAIDGLIQNSGAVSGTCAVPDATLTTPANILYLIQVCDISTGNRTSGRCTNAFLVVGLSGSTFALDHYGPPAVTTNVQPIVPSGHAGSPSGTCGTFPAVYSQTDAPNIYNCNTATGQWVLVAGAAFSMSYKGAWSSSTAYGLNDVAVASAVTYVSLVTPNLNHTPSTSPTQWSALGSNGASMVYPGAGIPTSTGTAWGTSLAAPASAIVGLSDTQALTNKTVDGVTPATLAYLDATSSIQTQLNSKASLAATTYSYRNAAKCRGGTAQSDDFTYYLSPQPSPGCVSVGNSPSGYFSFTAAATALVYVIDKVELPPYWTSTDISIQFTTPATTGNVTWLVNYYCILDGATISAGTFGSAASITTTVNATANARTTSAVLTGFATTGCAAGASLTYQITRSQSDTAAQPALFFGATLIQHRSQ